MTEDERDDIYEAVWAALDGGADRDDIIAQVYNALDSWAS